MLLRIVVEQPDRTLAVPERERIGFMLALPMGLLDLQDGLAAVGTPHALHERRRSPRLERLDRGQTPALDQAGAGQRYASAWRFLSDGSFSRTSRSRARSSSAEITVSSSGACARTIPQGSTISERP
jgi:hypothetical protein